MIYSYYFETTLFLGFIICLRKADSLIFNFCARVDGDMAESGDTGFLIGIGGFNMLDVAKQLSILENFSIPVYSIVNYYIRSPELYFSLYLSFKRTNHDLI
jgi:hypothetical protein